MKTMKKLQVAVAAASLFAAAGSSMAASVSQSGLTIAREAISHNTASTQTLRAPTVTFNFDNGPAANGNSTQDFNVTLTLGGDGDGKWAAAAATYKTISALRRNNGNAVVPVLSAADAATHAAALANKVFIVFMDRDVVAGTNEKTFRYKFRLVNNTASSIGIGDLQLNFNGQNPGDGAAAPFDTGLTGPAQPFNATVVAAADGDYQRVKNLQTVVNSAAPVASGAGETGDVEGGCGEGIRKMTVTLRNYIGSGDGVEGESANSAANITNNGYIQFATALRVQLVKGVAVDRNTDPLNSNNRFVVPQGHVTSATEMSVGELQLSNRTVDGWDLSQQGAYYKLGANDLNDTNDEKNGNVDVSAVRLSLEATNGFAAGVKFRLSRTPVCDVGSAWTTATLTDSNKKASVSFGIADLVNANAFGAGSLTDTAGSGVVGAPFNIGTSVTDRAYVCMQVPGDALIPQSRFSGTAALLKFTSGGEDADEQANLSCKKDLAGLGGGIKIDVRNYSEFPADSEWRSYVRVINNSETQTADVSAQYIRADGSYGKYVKLFDLPPRAAKFLSDVEIRNLMATSGVESSAGAAGKQSYDNGLAAGYAGHNARLRISSEAASTLRVQNYLVNSTKGLLSEISSSQGADFVNVEASTRDHIDQDAQTGIKK